MYLLTFHHCFFEIEMWPLGENVRSRKGMTVLWVIIEIHWLYYALKRKSNSTFE